MEAQRFSVRLEQVEEFEFRVNFGPEFAQMVMDEPPPLGASKGPSPARMLAAAVGGCLSASLYFCLKKARLDPKHVKTEVSYTMERNAAGRLRIPMEHVSITLDLDADKERASRSLELFEEFCTVTQSVRQGIGVNVEVKNTKGEELHRSVIPPK
jgi:uncharacterized OsmC-like protein